MPGRKILITSADGQTGHLAAELLLTDEDFKTKYDSLTLLTANPSKCEDLKALGAAVISAAFKTDSVEDMAKKVTESAANAVYLIPPATSDKLEITKKLLEAIKTAGISNTLFLSSAGCDMANEGNQPGLRQFVEMERLLMKCKGDTTTETGHSSVIIRAGFYAENLLLYNKSAQHSGKLPLPMGKSHKFAPLALGDLAHLAAVILTSEGPHGFGDDVRGQLISLTGPQLVAGEELATAASQGLGTKIEYTELSTESANELLQSESDLDPSEIKYLLEYYSLVREGKTNYVSTLAFKQATGAEPTLPSEFFETYQSEFKPKKRRVSVKEVVGEGHSEKEKGDKVGASKAQDKEKTAGKRSKK